MSLQNEAAKQVAYCRLMGGNTDQQGMFQLAMGRYLTDLKPDDLPILSSLFENYLVNTFRTVFEKVDLSSGVEFRERSIRSGQDRIVSATVGKTEDRPGVDLKFIVRDQAGGGFKLFNAKFMNVDLLNYLRDSISNMADDPNGNGNPIGRIYEGLSTYPKCDP